MAVVDSACQGCAQAAVVQPSKRSLRRFLAIQTESCPEETPEVTPEAENLQVVALPKCNWSLLPMDTPMTPARNQRQVAQIVTTPPKIAADKRTLCSASVDRNCNCVAPVESVPKRRRAVLQAHDGSLALAFKEPPEEFAANCCLKDEVCLKAYNWQTEIRYFFSRPIAQLCEGIKRLHDGLRLSHATAEFQDHQLQLMSLASERGAMAYCIAEGVFNRSRVNSKVMLFGRVGMHPFPTLLQIKAALKTVGTGIWQSTTKRNHLKLLVTFALGEWEEWEEEGGKRLETRTRYKVVRGWRQGTSGSARDKVQRSVWTPIEARDKVQQHPLRCCCVCIVASSSAQHLQFLVHVCS